jgi:hypothetical protein
LQQFRPLLVFATLTVLSACATHQVPVNQSSEAARYRAQSHKYSPPGPIEDPWRPYIAEAAQRFDVPERWIREVMRVESGGQTYSNGEPITSPVGAMGLMQIMPDTYDELRMQYGLGDDPYDPHDNILAGAAYIREMYDVYGSPGFLAAYNAGPKRLDDYMNRNKPLPDETRRYVAMIGPYIRDSMPERRSPADQYAMALPVDIPPGPRRVGRARPRYAQRGTAVEDAPVQYAALPEPPRYAALPAPSTVPVAPHASGGRGFHFIPQAMAAEPIPFRHGGVQTGAWAIQVGAYASHSTAVAATSSAREMAHGTLAAAQPAVEVVQQGRGRLFRARFVGLSRDAAIEACGVLKHNHTSCSALSPEAQS